MFWAISTQIYSKMVNRLSVYRFNLYKSLIALPCFFIASYLLAGTVAVPTQTLGWLLFSGLFGFLLADLFIFYSFAKNGPARTLMLAAFEPSLVAILSYFILGKTLPLGKIIGLFFLITCLCFMALEKSRRGNVSLRVAVLALIGICIEAMGVVFSKKAFMIAQEMNSMTANLYRVMPAVICLPVINYFMGMKMGIGDLGSKIRMNILGSSLLGTFLALYFYLYAISHYDHPSIIAGLGSLAPIYASIYEHWRDKKLPNRYFIGAIVSMILGVFFLVFM
jgi:drug/metabolite transporter (DMT)-like permease